MLLAAVPALLIGSTACGPRGPRFFADDPPSGPVIGLTPPAPVTGDALQVDLELEPEDPEDDAIELRFAWTRDGEPVPDVTGPLVPAGRLVRGETWAVTVTPNDGRLDGPSASAEVVVGNAGPVLRAITLSPQVPKAGDAVLLELDAVDPEGDALETVVDWRIDGRAVTTAELLRLEAPLSRGQRVQVAVTVADAEVVTAPLTASVTVGNTLPTAPGLELLPVEPRPVRDDLVCRIVTPAIDADGDRLVTTLTWQRNGVAFPRTDFDGTRTVIPASLTGDGIDWRCLGQASDGVGTSPRTEVAVHVRSSGVGELVGQVGVTAVAELDFTGDGTALCGAASCDCTSELAGAGEALLYADHDQDVFAGPWEEVGGDCAPWFGGPPTLGDVWLVPPGPGSYLGVSFDPSLSFVTGLRVFGALQDDRAATSTPTVIDLPADAPAPLDHGVASGVTTGVPLGPNGEDGTATVRWTVTLVP